MLQAGVVGAGVMLYEDLSRNSWQQTRMRGGSRLAIEGGMSVEDAEGVGCFSVRWVKGSGDIRRDSEAALRKCWAFEDYSTRQSGAGLWMMIEAGA